MISHPLSFRTEDNLELPYRVWSPTSAPAPRTLVLLHRGHEHADRWESIIPSLAAPDTTIFAWNARGHGPAPGPRGCAPTFMHYVRDLDTFLRHLAQTHGVRPETTVLVAHSVGAVIASTWVHDYAPRLAGLVLATPAFDVNLIVPGALPSLRLLAKLRPTATISSYVKGDWLTRDPAAAAAYDNDPLVSKNISAKILAELFDASRRVITDAAVMDRPLLLLSAGKDRVIRRSAIDLFYQNYGAEIKIHHTLPDARHALFHDLCREEVATLVRQFAQRCFATFTPPSLAADFSHAATKREFTRLKSPARTLSALNYAVQIASMRTLGRLSQGIRIGYATGFDSGESLDYVYENHARGALGLGRVIDRAYLNAIGWQGIRQRRMCLGDALRHALQATKAQNLPPRLLDIAGGAGRYLLDLLSDTRTDPNLHIVCRDWSESALATGRTRAATLGLSHRIEHHRGDAFATASLAAVSPPPSIALVSGLYELFPDNALLQNSLRGLAQAVPSGGRLIYTNQPWHPQVEMIARTLPNRDGQPWIMRRRPQGEMDALVAAAGFTKERQWTDDFGIFTVSVARRSAPHA